MLNKFIWDFSKIFLKLNKYYFDRLLIYQSIVSSIPSDIGYFGS
jgi:hypothetical protein